MRARSVLSRRRLVATLSLSFSLQLAAIAQELVTLERGSAYELTWHGRDKLTAHVYVSRNATAKGPIAIALRGVADGKRTDPKLTGDFQLTPSELAEAATGFEISVPQSASLKAGTYEATLTFAAGTTRQNVNIQVIVPPATLAAPATLQLSRVVWPFRDAVPEGGTELLLLETSGKSHARVTLQQSEPFSNTEGQYGTGLVIAPADVEKGNLARLPANVTADLPFGTASTKLSIASDQLAAPLTVAVQVRTRRTKAVLAAVIVLGLFFGYLLRIRLKPSIELGTAREHAFAAINAMIDISDDAQYRREMNAARAALASAVMAADATPATLKAAMTSAETAQQTATTSLNSRLQTVTALRDNLAAVVTPPWTLPDAIAAAVAGAAARVKDGSKHLDDRNASAAEDILTAATGSLRQDLRSQVPPWRNNAQSVLRQLREVEPLIDTASKTAFAAAIEAAEDQVAKSTLSPTADVAAIKSAIEAIHAATEPFPDLIKHAADEVTRSFAFMHNVLADAATDPDSWARAHEETREFATALRGVAIESPDTWRQVESDTRALRDRWRKALLAQTTVPAVVAAFDESDFRKVARELEAALQVPPIGADVMARDDAGAAFGLRAPIGAVSASSLAERQRPPVAAPDPSSLLPFIERTRRQLMRETVLQWVLSATALTFVGYLIFADKFVGTNADLMAAFFWGFTTDIGVDALVSAAKSKPQ